MELFELVKFCGCDAFDAKAGKPADCTVETNPALDVALVSIVGTADGVPRSAVAGMEVFRRGGEVLMSVPAVKELWPNLILKTPSVVEFWGPLPILKSISFEPHCLTYVASLFTADE